MRPLLTLPDDALTAAIDNFRNGRVPGMDMHFPPSIPEIVAEARRLLPRVPDYPLALSAPAVSDEERKRIGGKMVKLAARLAKKDDAAREAALVKRRLVFSKANDYHRARDPRSREEQARDLIAALDRREAGA